MKKSILILFYLLICIFSTSIHASENKVQEEAQTQNLDTEKKHEASEKLLVYYKDFFPNLWFGTVEMPNTQNFIVLALGTFATTVAMFRFDNNIRNYVNTHPNFTGSWATIGNDELASSLLGVTIGLINIGYGLGVNSVYDIHAGEAQLETALATAIYTNVMKTAVGRERPTSKSKTSFPSGHTSITFAAAQSTTDMYGWYGLPVFLYAAYTGVSRISVNRHYLSDVLFGATLGSVVAHGYSVYHLKKYRSDIDKKQISNFGRKQKYARLYPYFETRNNFGLEFIAVF